MEKSREISTDLISEVAFNIWLDRKREGDPNADDAEQNWKWAELHLERIGVWRG